MPAKFVISYNYRRLQMTHILKAFGIHHSISFEKFIAPAIRAMVGMPQLESRGYRPLQMSFEDHPEDSHLLPS